MSVDELARIADSAHWLVWYLGRRCYLHRARTSVRGMSGRADECRRMQELQAGASKCKRCSVSGGFPSVCSVVVGMEVQQVEAGKLA